MPDLRHGAEVMTDKRTDYIGPLTVPTRTHRDPEDTAA